MNFIPEAAEYDAVVGAVSPRYGRLTNRDGLLDAWVLAGHPEQDSATLPDYPVRIDHCFVPASLADNVHKVWVVQDATGSDHWPVWVTLKAP